jgi:BON domain
MRRCLAVALLSLPAAAAALAAQEGQTFDPGCALPFAALAVRHPIDDRCGRDGGHASDPRAVDQDRVKNNFCAQGAPAAVTIATFEQLQRAVDQAQIPYGSSSRLPMDRGVLRDLVEVAPGRKLGEGSLVQLAAFIVSAHAANVASGEIVNCHLRGPEDNDLTIVLGESPTIDRCESVTAEMSPHFRPAAWLPGLLGQLDRPVRVTGQLFFDGSHRPCRAGQPANPKRISTWEIHPVYALEVCTAATLADCPAGDAAKWHPLDPRTAGNAAALELLRQGHSAEAAKVFAGREADVLAAADLKPADKALFLYNYGVALQQSHQADEAARRFLKSRELDPRVKEPVEAFLTLPWAELRHPSESVTPLIALLLAQKDLVHAGAALRFALMPAAAGDPAFYDALLPLLARYLTAARVGARELSGDWQPLLARASAAMDTRARDRAQLITQAYLSDMKVILDPERARAYTAPWQGGHEGDFAALLTAVGGQFQSAGSLDAALARYALAWSSAEQLEAAVQIAALLLSYRSQVDADGLILEGFIASIFESKGQAYLQGDWPHAFRLHSLLAGIFEKQRAWGSEGNPRSAIFQLSHALQASQRLDDKDLALRDAVPGLHARLGRALKQAGRARDAVKEYLAAARSYLAANRPEAAEAALWLAREAAAPAAMEPAQRRDLDELGARALAAEAKLAAESKPSDARTTAIVLAKLGADPEIDLDHVDVQTRDGVVTISGAGTRDRWHEIEQLVDSTAGVRSVRRGPAQ